MIISTLAAMTAGYILGMALGVPKAISARRLLAALCEKLAPWVLGKYQDSPEGRRTAGSVFVTLVLLIVLIPVAAVLILLYIFFPFGAIILDAVICWSVMDIKGISNAASIAARAVKVDNPLKAARYASMITGEDCSGFETDEAAKAAIGGIADRTVDTVTAPMLYMFLLSGFGAEFGLRLM